MSVFVQSIISGLFTGSVYTLLAIGLVLAYRTSRVLNLAHGETFAVAGLTAALLVRAGASMWLGVVGALVVAVAFSCALQRFLLRPRTHWPMSTLILITLGTAFVSRGALLVLAGSDPLSFPGMLIGPPIRIAGGALAPQGAVLIIVGLAVSFLVSLFLTLTRAGKQLRASAENPEAAQLLGVNVDRSRLLAYALAGLLGGLSGILLVPLIAVDFQTGLGLTLRGFIAAAIAGMVSPTGAILSGMGLGLFEALVAAYIGSLFRDPIVFTVLIAVALWQSRKIRFGGGARA